MDHTLSEIAGVCFVGAAVASCQLLTMVAAYRAGRSNSRHKADYRWMQLRKDLAHYKEVVKNQTGEFEKLALAHKTLKEQKGRILGSLRQLRRELRHMGSKKEGGL